MNSSVSATSARRQSASFAGREEVSRAFFLREISLWMRAETRAFISPTTFSMSWEACCLSSRLGEASLAASQSPTTLDTTERICGVPRISLVCPSNCGSGKRTVTTAVIPASTSSFSGRPSLAPTLSLREFLSIWARSTRRTACSNPATWVPPLGVAMMLTKERTEVS